MQDKEYYRHWYLKNKEKKLAKSKEWYKNNTERKLMTNKQWRDTHADSFRNYRQQKKDYVKWYRETHPCLHCGEADPCCLDFHHLNPETKETEVSRMINGGNWGLDALIEEIGKCVILCANCHRKEEARKRRDKATGG